MKESYKKVPIESLKPDPNQPRKVFDEEYIEGLSVSIKNEGVINAIEVDENMTIITGEQRWRASKMAGLKEVPIKIIEKLSKEDRFIRQVQENIHHGTMSPLETANALEKVRQFILKTNKDLKKTYQKKYYQNIAGCYELSEIFGKRSDVIANYLELLGVKGELREALKNRKFSVNKIDMLKSIVPKYKKEVEHIVATQIELPRETFAHMKNAIRRGDKYGEDEKVKRLLKENFVGVPIADAVHRINKIIPTEEDRIKEPSDAARVIGDKVMEILSILEDHPLESFDPLHMKLVQKDLNALGFFTLSYLKGELVEGKKNLLLNKGK